MSRRVVITGLGAITPLGNDVDSFWQGIVAGKSGISNIVNMDVSNCLLYTSPSPRDATLSRMPSSA